MTKVTFGRCGWGFKVYADGKYIGNVVLQCRIGLPFGWIHDCGGNRWYTEGPHETRREAGEALLRVIEAGIYKVVVT